MTADVLRSEVLSLAGFAHGFALRTGGVSQGPFATLNLGRRVGDDLEAVLENHRRLATSIGYDLATFFETNQVHGRVVRTVGPDDDPAEVRAEDADVIVASRAGIAVGARTADCAPVLVADPRTGLVASVHAGWRGVAARAVDAAIDALASLGAEPAGLRVAVGPHVRACCFEVGDDVAAELSRVAHGANVVDRTGHKPHVDLARILRAQIEARGVAALHLDDVGGCTMCDASRYFSFRRDGKRSGRHSSVIVARLPATL